MNEQELLLALRNVVKEEVQPIKDDIRELKIRVGNIETRVENIETRVGALEERATQRETNLENNINKNIQLLKEGHCDLVREIKEIKKDTSRIERIETELFATREITKENVQSIKKLQSKEK